MTMKILDFICMTAANAIVRFLSVLPRKNAYASSPSAGKKHVLILANNRLGDALVRLPFHKAMREAFPPETHHIAIILDHPIAELFGRLPYFDEIIPASPLHFSHALFWIFPKRGYKGVNLIRWAFRHKVDIYIETFRDRPLGSDYIAYLSSPYISIGYDILEMARIFPSTSRYQNTRFNKMYTHMLPSVYGGSQFDDYQTIFQYATKQTKQLTPVKPEELKPLLAQNAIPQTSTPYTVFVPGAVATYRRWPASRFMELSQKLNQTIVVVGSHNEAPLGDSIPNALNLCGKTTLSELGKIIANASLVVSNETGTATYAAVLGIPTIVILGGGDFGAFFPNDHYPNTKSVFHHEDCFNCRWQCSKCKFDNENPAPCISSISVDDILNAIKSMRQS